MKQYGVLVVDDSSFMRRSISLIIEKDPQFFIIGIARNGLDAIEKIQRLKPDVVTMDVEMPEMDGITALERIMKTCPVPVVMLSNKNEEETTTTIKALELGAIECFTKNSLLGEEVKEEAIIEFLGKLKVIAHTGNKLQKNEKDLNSNTEIEVLEVDNKKLQRELLVIGCSTGGPSALQSILPRFPKNLNIPIVVIQHMPPGFTKPLAERFDTICNLNVKEIENGDILEAGNIYIAPAGFQTILEKNKDNTVFFKVDNGLATNSLYKPSINVTLNSAAPIFKDKLLSVILTGMGNDGLDGCKNVKENKGCIIVEAEESCIVYGMPKVVFEAGIADLQVSLSNMFDAIMSEL